MTLEHRTAFAAVLSGALLALLSLWAGAGLGAVAVAALAGYAGPVWLAASRWRIRTSRVLRATTRGAVVAAVLAALALIGVGRALSTVVGVS